MDISTKAHSKRYLCFGVLALSLGACGGRAISSPSGEPEIRHEPTDRTGGSGATTGAGGNGPTSSTGGTGATHPGSGGAEPVAGAPNVDPEPDPVLDVELTLIDDFEDGDRLSRRVGEAKGYWSALASDQGSINPGPDADTYAAPPGNESDYAAALTGEGMAKWGAILHLTLDVPDLENPEVGRRFDASEYDGIAFWIRGAGSVHCAVETADFVGVAYGGDCTETTCWGSYEKLVAIPDEWQYVELPFSEMVQPVFANPLAFDTGKVLGLGFTGAPPDFEIRLDDLSFFKRVWR